MRLLPKFTGRQLRSRHSAPPSRRLCFEPVEARKLLAAFSFDLASGVLSITGTKVGDYATVDYGPNQTVKASINEFSAGGIEVLNMPLYASQVKEIRFTGGDGNDAFFNNTNIRSKAWGNSGDDTLVGGGWIDTFEGNSGRDTLLGRGGDDQLYGDYPPVSGGDD